MPETQGELLYDRRARLIIGGQLVESEGSQGLKIAFSVQRAANRTANTANIRVFNLSKETRGKIQGRVNDVVLEAGYKSTSAVIFAGSRAIVTHTKQGTEWITSIKAGDGWKSLRRNVFVSFGPTTAKDVLDALLRLGEIGAKARGSAQLDQVLGSKVFSKGRVLRGRVDDLIEDLAGELGLDWSIEQEELVMLPPGEALRQPGIILGPESGLIGTPSRIFDPKRPKALVVRGKSLLQPGLTPFRRVDIRSQDIQGVFKVRKCTHTGDIEGADEAWVTSFEATAI